METPRIAEDRREGGGREGSHEEDHAEDKDEEDLQVEEGMYLKSKLWWLGLGLIAIGEGGNFLSYGFVSFLVRICCGLSLYLQAPASVVAPLGTVVRSYCYTP